LIDRSVVRGLEYYTSPVFEAELTRRGDRRGRQADLLRRGRRRRYDGIVARFREEPVPAIGFSIGMSRLLAALRAIESPIVAAAESAVPLSCSRSTAMRRRWPTTSASVAALQGAGIAELYLGAGGMNAQLNRRSILSELLLA
jgi:histidyl-tRNA synthetase